MACKKKLTVKKTQAKLSPELITSIASVVIATCAVIVTVYWNAKTQEHNRLLLMPALDVVANGIYVNFTNETIEPDISIKIENNGLGPARIKKVTFKDIRSGKVFDHPLEYAEHMGFDYYFLMMYSYEDRPLKIGGMLPIYKIDQKKLTERSAVKQLEGIQDIQHRMRNMEVHVEYESFLGDKVNSSWTPDPNWTEPKPVKD